MTDRIVVTSLGIVSALGRGAAENLHALTNSRSGLRYLKHLQTVHASEFMTGEVDLSNEQMMDALGIPAHKEGYTRTTLLALLAMEELLAGIDKKWLRDEPLAFINANTIGGMCSVEDLYWDFVGEKKEGKFLDYIDTLDCAESTLNISSHFGLKPFMATISTACSSSANSIVLGARMIKQGIVKRAICGGCDALSRYTLNGFNSLKNLDRGISKPFDQNRMGLNLGEGAGYLMLESESSAKERGAEVLAVFSGYSNSNDAYHPTAPSPDGAGAYRTMQLALDKAELTPNDIGYINTHGTATINNDNAEGRAIERLFGTGILFSSTKPYTGHTLAAAGAVEAIFSVWALQHGMAFSNLNFETKMEELNITPVASLKKDLDSKHVLSNSFGFGGNNVSLIFSRA
jgi:3-oxoacyl-[acyl-carrier-protein] synthase-1